MIFPIIAKISRLATTTADDGRQHTTTPTAIINCDVIFNIVNFKMTHYLIGSQVAKWNIQKNTTTYDCILPRGLRFFGLFQTKKNQNKSCCYRGQFIIILHRPCGGRLVHIQSGFFSLKLWYDDTLADFEEFLRNMP